MNFIKALIKEIIVRPMPIYDPANAIQWKRKPRQKRTETDDEIQTDKRFNMSAMKYETKTILSKDASEWILHGQETTRTDILTGQDIQVLKDRKIENLKEQARHIKPLWAQMMSRSQIVFELKKRNLKRGYSESNIGKICAALSFSNGEHEAE